MNIDRGLDITWGDDNTATIMPRAGQRVILRIPRTHNARPADESGGQGSGVDVAPESEEGKDAR